MASFVCASYGADVIFLDYNQNSLDLCKLSHELFLSDNKHIDNQTFSFLLFDMENEKLELPYCDLLIMSDVTYYNNLAKAAAKRVQEAKTKYNSKILITDCGRKSTTIFTNELEQLLNNNKNFDFNMKEISSNSTLSKGYYLWIE